MPSLFSKIIQGDIPARFVWRDSQCVAFMDIQPLNRGHVLVIPNEEIDEWVDLNPKTVSHLMLIAHKIAKAQKATLAAHRVGLMIAGFDVPHVHIHVVPIESLAHLDFSQADTSPDPDDLDVVAGLLSTFLNGGRSSGP
ncbi:MAG: HIT family protein [Acidimicrobiaceae bacterium]|nr:HIT family protein [Acidimicrobiaceae bacterium]